MPKFRVQPHLMASHESVRWAGWFVVTEAERRPVGPLLLGWDYNQALRIGSSPTVDLDELLDSTGLTDLEHVHLVLIVDCAPTARRFVASTPVLDYLSDVDPFLTVAIPQGSVALELKLTCHLALLADVAAAGVSASRKGSRLAESPTFKLMLEGDASRFPTEALSFEELRWEPAAWSVRIVVEDMNEAFSGAVRLILNTDHPVGSALASMEPRTYGAIASVLRVDIVRAVLLEAIERISERAGSTTGFDEESFGAVAEQMSNDYFATGLLSLAELRRSDSSRFERVLQGSVGIEVVLP